MSRPITFATSSDGGTDDAPTIVQAGSGNTTLYGGAGTAVLQGGSGNDTFFAGSGDETLVGGSGSNTFIVNANTGNVEVTYGAAATWGTLQFADGTSASQLTATGALDSQGAAVLEIDGLGGAIQVNSFSNVINGFQFGSAGGISTATDSVGVRAKAAGRVIRVPHDTKDPLRDGDVPAKVRHAADGPVQKDARSIGDRQARMTSWRIAPLLGGCALRGIQLTMFLFQST